MNKKIILIVLVSSFLAFLIFRQTNEKKLNIAVLGDGISCGETSFNVRGISFNDYLKEYFSEKRLLKSYNSTFSQKNYKVADLLNDLNNNKLDKANKLHLKQVLHKANIITLAIGEEELTKLNITGDSNIQVLKDFIFTYDKIISIIKDSSEAKIVIVSFFENKYLDKSSVIILNSELANIALKYDLIFININDLMFNKDYFFNEEKYYFNYKGHKEIAKLIINSL